MVKYMWHFENSKNNHFLENCKQFWTTCYINENIKFWHLLLQISITNNLLIYTSFHMKVKNSGWTFLTHFSFQSQCIFIFPIYSYFTTMYYISLTFLSLYIYLLKLMIICKWPSGRTVVLLKRHFTNSHIVLVRLSYFYKIYGLNEVAIMPFKKQKPFFLKQVPKIQECLENF